MFPMGATIYAIFDPQKNFKGNSGIFREVNDYNTVKKLGERDQSKIPWFTLSIQRILLSNGR